MINRDINNRKRQKKKTRADTDYMTDNNDITQGLLCQLYKRKRLQEVIDDWKVNDSLFDGENGDIEGIQRRDQEILAIDDNVALTLWLIYGGMFMRALRIVAEKDVHIYATGEKTECLARDSSHGSATITMVVEGYSNHHGEAQVQAIRDIDWSRIVRCVQGGGGSATASATSSTTATTGGNIDSPSESVYVTDIHSWYCSCDEYQRCYVSNWKGEEECGDFVCAHLLAVSILGCHEDSQMFHLHEVGSFKEVLPLVV